VSKIPKTVRHDVLCAVRTTRNRFQIKSNTLRISTVFNIDNIVLITSGPIFGTSWRCRVRHSRVDGNFTSYYNNYYTHVCGCTRKTVIIFWSVFLSKILNNAGSSIFAVFFIIFLHFSRIIPLGAQSVSTS